MRDNERASTPPAGPSVLAAQMTDTAPVLGWSRIQRDLGLVGGGVLSGTIGSVWAVLLTERLALLCAAHPDWLTHADYPHLAVHDCDLRPVGIVVFVVIFRLLPS